MKEEAPRHVAAEWNEVMVQGEVTRTFSVLNPSRGAAKTQNPQEGENNLQNLEGFDRSLCPSCSISSLETGREEEEHIRALCLQRGRQGSVRRGSQKYKVKVINEVLHTEKWQVRKAPDGLAGTGQHVIQLSTCF